MHKFKEKEIITIAALLIHAAKIDEIYSDHEKKIIIDFIGNNTKDKSQSQKILTEAEILEADSNQLLNYTNIIKQNTLDIKKDIIEHLWKVIISDNSIDQYEANLMRRICGLIYLPDKECAEIKLKLLNSK